MTLIQEGRTTEAGEELNQGSTKYSAKQLGEALVQTARVIFNSDLIETLLEQEGIDVNYQDKNGDTALIAAFLGHLKLVGAADPFKVGKEKKMAVAKLLIEGGADMNIQNNLGHTASTLAITYNVDEFLQWGLAEKKIDPNFQTKNPRPDKKLVEKSTLLMSAASQAKSSCIKLLLSHEANPGLQDALGRTALMILMEKKWDVKDAAKLLIDAMTPKQLGCRDKEGKTAVFYFLARTFQKGDEEIAEFLIEKMKHNDLFKVTKSDRSAFHNLLDKDEPTVEDVAIAQLFIDQMSAQEANAYHLYATKKKNPLPEIFTSSRKNKTRLRSGSTASQSSKYGRSLTRPGKRSSAAETKSARKRLKQAARPRKGTMSRLLRRAKSTPKVPTPRDQIVSTLEKKKRGSLIE